MAYEVPTKQRMRRALAMLTSGLITGRHVQPWSCALLAELDDPPPWLCELAMLRVREDIERCLREFVFAPPFERFELDALTDFEVSALLLRHERREVSWGTFLARAGELTDGASAGSEDCEFFYDLLNQLEDGEHAAVIEERQRRAVLDIYASGRDAVVAEFTPFLEAFRDEVRRSGR